MNFTSGNYGKAAAASAVNKLPYVCNKNNIIIICETAAAAAADHKSHYICNKNNILTYRLNNITAGNYR